MKKITFEERPVGTREVRAVKVFSLEDIEQHFNEALRRIREQLKVSAEISAGGHEEEGAEMLRSQVVFIESAYDYFLHELIRLGVLNIFGGEWSDNDSKYLELQVSLGVLKKALLCQDTEDWLLEWITEKYSHVTLMDYSSLKDICGLLGISVKEVADLAFYRFGSDVDTELELERELHTLYQRRNQIAHQSDREMGTAEREEISCEYVEDKINNVRKIVLALCEVARFKGREKKRRMKIGSWIKSLRSDLLLLLKVRICQRTKK